MFFSRSLFLFVFLVLAILLPTTRHAFSQEPMTDQCALESYRNYLTQFIDDTDRKLSEPSGQAAKYAGALGVIFAYGSFEKADPITEILRPTDDKCAICSYDSFLGGIVCKRPSSKLLEKEFKDYSRAYIYFERAHKLGDAASSVELAKLYIQGRGTPKNLSRALEVSLVAAKKGLIGGQYIAAKLYEGANEVIYIFNSFNLYGEDKKGGLEPNLILAYVWFNLASASGDYSSTIGRRRLEKLLTPDEIVRAQNLSSLCKESAFKNCSD
jgi:hypothetical protein